MNEFMSWCNQNASNGLVCIVLALQLLSFFGVNLNTPWRWNRKVIVQPVV